MALLTRHMAASAGPVEKTQVLGNSTRRMACLARPEEYVLLLPASVSAP